MTSPGFQHPDLSLIQKSTAGVTPRRLHLLPVFAKRAPVSAHIPSSDVDKLNWRHLKSSCDWITLLIASYEFPLCLLILYSQIASYWMCVWACAPVCVCVCVQVKVTGAYDVACVYNASRLLCVTDDFSLPCFDQKHPLNSDGFSSFCSASFCPWNRFSHLRSEVERVTASSAGNTKRTHICRNCKHNWGLPWQQCEGVGLRLLKDIPLSAVGDSL